jgi:hypothetical protein
MPRARDYEMMSAHGSLQVVARCVVNNETTSFIIILLAHIIMRFVSPDDTTGESTILDED